MVGALIASAHTNRTAVTPAFRLGLVGAGMITRVSHLPAALSSPIIQVTAIVDPSVERATGLARAYGIAPAIGPRVEDVLDVIDGAVIATPNNTHKAVATACLMHRRHVLIEKPLATTYDEGLAILRAAESTGTTLAVGYSSRHRQSVKLLKELLDEEYFGRVRRFAHQFGTPGGWAPLSAYNLDRRAAGGGVLVVTGTHFLDRLLYLWGYPSEVELEDDSLGGPEANCTATFHYSGRRVMIGIARYSKTVKLPAGLVIDAEQGYVILRETDDDQIIFRPHGASSVEHVIRARTSAGVPLASEFQLQLEDFVRACQTGTEPKVTGRQGLQSLQLLEQLYRNRRAVTPVWYDEEQMATA